MNAHNLVSKIVVEYRISLGAKGKPTPVRDFAAILSKALFPVSASFQAVSQWENGDHLPSLTLLLRLADCANDWRREFALDLLAALRPDLYKPVGEIGQDILGAGQEIEMRPQSGLRPTRDDKYQPALLPPV